KVGTRGDLSGMVLDPGTLGGVRGTISTSTAPGFVQIQTIRSITPPPTVMMSGKTPTALMTTGESPRMAVISGKTAGATIEGGPGGGGTPRMATGGGASGGAAGRAPMGSSSSAMTATSALAPVSLAFSISNPFSHDFTQVNATLKIDGNVIATKALGTLNRFE